MADARSSRDDCPGHAASHASPQATFVGAVQKGGIDVSWKRSSGISIKGLSYQRARRVPARPLAPFRQNVMRLREIFAVWYIVSKLEMTIKSTKLRIKMTKQISKFRLWSLPGIIAICLTSYMLGVALAEVKNSIGAIYGAREPRTLKDSKAPAKGPITAALAKKYLESQMEKIFIGDLYLVENVKVQVGGGIPYVALIGRSFPEIDVNHPVYPIRGSLTRYQCVKELAGYTHSEPDRNCTRYEEPKAKGYCYKTTFGDWRCYMSDPNSTNKENTSYNVAPPKGKNADAVKAAARDKPATNTAAKPTNGNPTDKKEDKPDGDRDENGFPKPDFSEMGKYVEIIKYDYSPVTGRLDLVVKAKKEINIYRWYLTAYDADGVKVNELALNGGPIPLPIGEPTRIYSYAPNEREIKRVTRITITRKLD